LGVGWYILFFMGVIPIIVHLFAAALIVAGLAGVFGFVEKWACFKLKNNTEYVSKDIGNSGKEIIKIWMMKHKIKSG